jgi:hypothetical protein
MSMLSQKRKSKVEPLGSEQLKVKAGGRKGGIEFSAIQCGDTIIFLTSKKFCAEFIQKI